MFIILIIFFLFYRFFSFNRSLIIFPSFWKWAHNFASHFFHFPLYWFLIFFFFLLIVNIMSEVCEISDIKIIFIVNYIRILSLRWIFKVPFPFLKSQHLFDTLFHLFIKISFFVWLNGSFRIVWFVRFLLEQLLSINSFNDNSIRDPFSCGKTTAIIFNDPYHIIRVVFAFLVSSKGYNNEMI